MVYSFAINPAALKRNFAVYVVIARGGGRTQLYVGKTGDNRAGCNPLISRCGNHFSYNKIHSQVRNKVEAHETWHYTYVFDHFDVYCEDVKRRRIRIDRINEAERWLNLEIQDLTKKYSATRVINEYRGRSWIAAKERKRRAALRTPGMEKKIAGIVRRVENMLRSNQTG